MTGEKKAAATKYHRKALLTVADRLLTEFGYDGMNMNLLSKEAKYSKATVYVYFRSKDEIVRELCIERLKLLRGELGLVIKNDFSVEEKFTEIGKVLEEFATEDSVYFDFVTSGKQDGDIEASEEGESGKERLKSLVVGIMDDLSKLAPVDELKRRWYAFYGRIKTAKMFDAADI